MIEETAENAKEFNRLILKLADKFEADVVKVVKKTCLDLYSGIVRKTPVETGTAKGNWAIQFGNGDDSLLIDIQGGDVEANFHVRENIKYFNSQPLGEYVTIFNNVEYITYLEEGTDKFAPFAMVATTFVNFNKFLQNAIDETG